MWGHKRKVRGHTKKISAGAAPHLQIGSDATEPHSSQVSTPYSLNGFGVPFSTTLSGHLQYEFMAMPLAITADDFA